MPKLIKEWNITFYSTAAEAETFIVLNRFWKVVRWFLQHGRCVTNAEIWVTYRAVKSGGRK